MFFALLALVAAATVGGFWVLMLVDSLTHRDGGNGARSDVRLVLLAGPVGAVVYFFSRALKRPTRRDASVRSECIGALLNGCYHALMLVVFVGVCVYLLPQFARFFEGRQVRLPYLFTSLAAFSGWLTAWWWVALPAAVIMLAYDSLLYWAIRRLSVRLVAYVYSSVVGGGLMLTCALSLGAVLASRASIVDAI